MHINSHGCLGFHSLCSFWPSPQPSPCARVSTPSLSLFSSSSVAFIRSLHANYCNQTQVFLILHLTHLLTAVSWVFLPLQTSLNHAPLAIVCNSCFITDRSISGTWYTDCRTGLGSLRMIAWMTKSFLPGVPMKSWSGIHSRSWCFCFSLKCCKLNSLSLRKLGKYCSSTSSSDSTALTRIAISLLSSVIPGECCGCHFF